MYSVYLVFGVNQLFNKPVYNLGVDKQSFFKRLMNFLWKAEAYLNPLVNHDIDDARSAEIAKYRLQTTCQWAFLKDQFIRWFVAIALTFGSRKIYIKTRLRYTRRDQRKIKRKIVILFTFQRSHRAPIPSALSHLSENHIFSLRVSTLCLI